MRKSSGNWTLDTGHFGRSWSRLRGLHRSESGTAAVSFILCLPIFLTIVAIIVQYALIVNAKIIVTSAAANAARAAMTSLPEETPDNVTKAARFSVVPVSPKAKGQPDAEGFAIASALLTVKNDPNNPISADKADKFVADFAARYTYAMEAVTVDYPALPYKFKTGQDIDVTVHYKMLMTVPIWQFAFGKQDIVGGVKGKYFTIKSTVRVQTAHGRGANADNWGLPQ